MVNTNHLSYMETTNSLETVMIHEIGHVLGIGTYWRQPPHDLLRPSTQHCENPGLAPGTTRTFVGAHGVTEFGTLGGVGAPPLDATCHHWNESRFRTEVLTPTITIDPNGNNHQPLSRMTVGALEDLGYAVNYAAADAYSLPLPGLHTHEHDGETFVHGEPILIRPDLEGR